MPTTEMETLWTWLDVHRCERPDHVALYGMGDQVTYDTLAGDVERMAAGLADLGVAAGDVVAAQLPNGRAFVTAFLATTALGATFLPLHMPYRGHELLDLLTRSGARAVLAVSSDPGASQAAAMAELRMSVPSLDHVIAVGPPCDGTISYSTLAATPARRGLVGSARPSDRYLLLYTSGTTGSPKGVPHRYEAFLGNAWRSAGELAIDAESRILSLAAFSHLYGLFTVHLALAAGAGIALMPGFDPRTLAQDLDRIAATHVFAAPAHFSALVTQGGLTPEHLRATQVLCLSGTTVPQSLATGIDALLGQGTVIQLWGMSELQAGAFGRPGDPLDTRISTAGRASPRTDLRVTGPDGAVLAAGQEGQLELRGASVFEGYLNDTSETAAAFTADGWFRTGDLAILDTDGFLRLTGRTKELINRGGVKYNPVEIETIVLGHAGVRNCAVVPVPDPDLGERGCLCIEAAPGQAVSLDDIRALLERHGVARYKWPERIAYFDTLPLTPTRKVIRGRLAAMAVAGTASNPT